ncbi:hypothetical protein Acr_26g0010040 [Actinidia rufa]|uniref:Uncharacterized protein n=1 Tax=Actinidia rufa TaxID=165716 RepID=A0A7J0H4P8_9ERIC|nr:hypothetical protein Acr_26g0010040 [Actinidia rufa]
MNGGSVGLIKASIVTRALISVLMASIWAFKSLIFWVVDLSQCLGVQSSWQGDLPLLLVFSPFASDGMCLTSALATLRVVATRSVRTARSVNFFLCRGYGKRLVVHGEMLYQAGIVLIHDPNMLDDPMHLTVEALKI